MYNKILDFLLLHKHNWRSKDRYIKILASTIPITQNTGSAIVKYKGVRYYININNKELEKI